MPDTTRTEMTPDQAGVQAAQAGTIQTLIAAGFTPTSVVEAVKADDWDLLNHGGRFSVYLAKD
jgi:hypothetical protein